MKILLLLLVLLLPLILEVSADEKCYYFNTTFGGCPDLKQPVNHNFIVVHVWDKQDRIVSSYVTGSTNRDDCTTSGFMMERLAPCVCRTSYNEPLFHFLPEENGDVCFVYCLIGEKAIKKNPLSKDRTVVRDLLINKAFEYAAKSCSMSVLKQLIKHHMFKFAALKNNIVYASSTLLTNKAGLCDKSILEPCLRRSNLDEPHYFFLPDYATFKDYPAVCIVGEKANNKYSLDDKDSLIKKAMENAINSCSIFKQNKVCGSEKLLQNEMFTFAALKNNTVFYSTTSIIKKAVRCDMSILEPCLCRPSYDEPVFFFLPDYDTFVDYPAICIVGNAANEKYQFGSDLEIYDLLISKKIEYMPRSLINPFIIDHNTTNSSCTDMNGNPTKDVNGQKTCMISFSDESDEFMYAGPLIGSSMLDFDDNENFKKSDITEACRSTTNVSEFDQTWTDWCFWKNSFSKLKFQCCCVSNPMLCSPPRIRANETNNLLCHPSAYYEKKGLTKKKEAEDFLKRYAACYVLLYFGYDDKNNTDFQIRYSGNKKCDKSNSTQIFLNEPKIFCSSILGMVRNITVQKCCKNAHFCNHKFVPENYETTECAHQNRMEQIALGTSDSTCTHFFDLRIENFTKILIGYNAEIPEGQPRKFNQTSSNNQSLIYDLNYVYAKILKVDNSTLCPIRHYNASGEYRPIMQVSCEGNKCDEDIFKNIPFDIPKFQCQNLSEPFVKDGKYEAVMENSVGWICYVEIKNFTVHAGELKDFTNHTECLEADVFQSGKDESFCCSNVFNVSQANRSCTIDKLIEKSPNIATPNDQKEDLISQYYCDIKNVPNIPCSDPGCFVSRVPEQSDDSNPIEPAGCIQNAEKYIIDDKDNSQMASISLACKSAEWNGCSLLKDVEGNERIVCCCNGNECDKLQRTVPEKVGKPVSSYRSH